MPSNDADELELAKYLTGLEENLGKIENATRAVRETVPKAREVYERILASHAEALKEPTKPEPIEPPTHPPAATFGINVSRLAQESACDEFTNAIQLGSGWTPTGPDRAYPWGQGKIDWDGEVLTLDSNEGAALTLYRNNGSAYRKGTYRFSARVVGSHHGFALRVEGEGARLISSGPASPAGTFVTVDVFEPRAAGLVLHVGNTSDRTVEVTDFRFVHEDEANSERFWGSQFLKTLSATGAQVVRTLNLQNLDRDWPVSASTRTQPDHLFQAGRYGVASEHVASLSDYGFVLWYHLPPYADDSYLVEDALAFAERYRGKELHLQYSNEDWNGGRKNAWNWKEQVQGGTFDDWMKLTWSRATKAFATWLKVFAAKRPEVVVHLHYDGWYTSPYHSELFAKSEGPIAVERFAGIHRTINLAIAPYIGHNVAEQVIKMLEQGANWVTCDAAALALLDKDLLAMPKILGFHRQALPKGIGISGYEANNHTMDPRQDTSLTNFIEWNAAFTRSQAAASRASSIVPQWRSVLGDALLCWYCLARPVTAWSSTGLLDSVHQYPDEVTSGWKALIK